MRQNFDVLIVGGGVTGAAVGYGLAKKGVSVGVVDATPSVDRASRSNMGLIWCQSKALGNRDYVEWCFNSSKLFGDLAKDLKETSGIDIEYTESGGIIPCLGEEEFTKRSDYLDALRKEAGEEGYPGTMMTREELEAKLPNVTFGPNVTGATWCAEDGLVEPLKLMFALRHGITNLGGTLIPDTNVIDAVKTDSGYLVTTDKGEIECNRLVLAGGLGNRQLAGKFGVNVPVVPNKGQVFLTERIPDILPSPLLGITRTRGGTVMIGFEHEYVGTDTSLHSEKFCHVAKWATDIWPALADLRIIRTWSCLRVWPKDGFPIYDKIPGHENGFILNAHSAVTLAAVHVAELPDYIMGNDICKTAANFTLSRFDEK